MPILKFPLDHVCIKTGILCPRCQKLVSSGSVEPFEIEIMRKLIDLEGDQELRKYMQSLGYIKAYKFEDSIVVLVQRSGDVPPDIYQRLSRILSEDLNARVRVINGSSRDLKNIASQLLFPARILGINIVWLPNGTSFHVLRVSRRDLRYVSIPIEAAERILSLIVGSDVQIKGE
ncbi:MAG: transcription elongation factor [Desulfurococcales archaeon]|nr:transcription elongation factor [Desulfurococcales archaeon]